MAENVEARCSTHEDEPAEGGVSMIDVLEEEKQLEDDANAVLGDSDDKNCTYLMGYVPRQALYACITCISPKADMAGVCLACSLDCHSGHDLVELYTKRNFRCDCGNKKFGEKKCKLLAEKCTTNADNIYNQNFKGTYCSCERPYPDPDDDIEDDMIQCSVCEDWFHGRHLGSDVPDDFEEIVCAACMKKCDFLWTYTTFSTETKTLETVDSGESVDVETASTSSASVSSEEKDSSMGNKEKNKENTTSITGENTGVKCQLEDLQKRQLNKHDGATFWPEHWRKKLCRCDSCKSLYENLKVAFLLQETDCIKAYEERGRLRASSRYEDGMQILSGMDRVQQVEMLHGYNDMKSQLTDYLKKFADNKKVVREEDIREFFQSLAANKKQKTSAAPQYFCK